MPDRLRNILITVGWTILATTIILNALFGGLQRQLTIIDLVMIFAASLISGMLIVDAEYVVICCLVSVGITSLAVFLGLTIPVTMNTIQYEPLREMLSETLTTSAIAIVVRVTFLSLLVPSFLGAILGGILGEYLRI